MNTMKAYWNGHLIKSVDNYQTRYGIRSVIITVYARKTPIHVTLRDIMIGGIF